MCSTQNSALGVKVGLSDAVFYGFPCKLRPKPKIAKTMDPKVPLEQLLASIPQQRLDQKVGDAHLAEISRDLTKWRSVCTSLRISEAEEKAIEEENKEVDVQR